MFRAVVFAVLTLVLSRELGDGTVPVRSANTTADVPAMEALLADAASPAPATDPIAGRAEDLFQDKPAILDSKPLLEESLANNEGQKTAEVAIASNLIPADDLLMSFDAWSPGAYPAFSGAGEEQDVEYGGPQTSNWSGMGGGSLPQAGGRRTRDESKKTVSDHTGEDTATDTDADTDPGTDTSANTDDGKTQADEVSQPELPPTDEKDSVVSVPEPGTAPLLALGLAALLLANRRKVLVRR